MLRRIAILWCFSSALIGGCKQETFRMFPDPFVWKRHPTTLDWKPEPEFGGFYAANQDGAFSRHGLNVSITPAGEGADTWQTGRHGKNGFRNVHRRSGSHRPKTECGRDRDLHGLPDFSAGDHGPSIARDSKTSKMYSASQACLLAEDNSWLHFLENRFSPVKVQIANYSGGIAEFLAKKDFSQQCFVTSEPILAKHQGGRSADVFDRGRGIQSLHHRGDLQGRSMAQPS